jgi:hypothetical protein
MKKTIKNKDTGRRKTMRKRRKTRKMGGMFRRPLKNPIYLPFNVQDVERLLDSKTYILSDRYKENMKQSAIITGLKYNSERAQKYIKEGLRSINRELNKYDPLIVELYYKAYKEKQEEQKKQKEQEEKEKQKEQKKQKEQEEEEKQKEQKKQEEEEKQEEQEEQEEQKEQEKQEEQEEQEEQKEQNNNLYS